MTTQPCVKPADAERRRQMVASQLAARDVRDPRVLAAMAAVPREEFVPHHLRDRAYRDLPLPIGEGQTISQPYVVALSAQAAALCPGDRVLDVGTGSGYAAAVYAQIAAEVISIERIASLAHSATERLERIGVENVQVVVGDGTLGYPAAAPYDAVIVAAAGPWVPEALLDQLAVGGRLVMPVGTRSSQELTCVTRVSRWRYRYEALGGVRFVALVGADGWDLPTTGG